MLWREPCTGLVPLAAQRGREARHGPRLCRQNGRAGHSRPAAGRLSRQLPSRSEQGCGGRTPCSRWSSGSSTERPAGRQKHRYARLQDELESFQELLLQCSTTCAHPVVSSLIVGLPHQDVAAPASARPSSSDWLSPDGVLTDKPGDCGAQLRATACCTRAHSALLRTTRHGLLAACSGNPGNSRQCNLAALGLPVIIWRVPTTAIRAWAGRRAGIRFQFCRTAEGAQRGVVDPGVLRGVGGAAGHKGSAAGAVHLPQDGRQQRALAAPHGAHHHGQAPGRHAQLDRVQRRRQACAGALQAAGLSCTLRGASWAGSDMR